MSRLLLILGIFVLFSGTVLADVDSINVTINVAAINDDELHAPRFQAFCLGPDSVLKFGQGSATWLLSTDGFASFATTWDTDPGPLPGNDHDHGWIEAGVVHRTGRNLTYTDSVRYGEFTVSSGTIANDQNVGFGTDCGYAEATAGILPFGDLLIGTIRGGSCNFRYVITDDDFTTQTTGWVQDYSASGLTHTSARQGSHIAFGDSTVVMSAWLGWDAGADTLDLWWFDPSDSSWDRETSAPLVAQSLDRFYSANTTNDSLVFVATWGGGGLNSDSLFIASHRTTSQTTWTQDTLRDTSLAAIGGAALTLIESTGRMLLWEDFNGTLRVRYFKDDFTWSASQDVMIDTTIDRGKYAVPRSIPASHGSVAYLAVTASGSGNTYLIKADIYEASGEAVVKTIGGGTYGGGKW